MRLADLTVWLGVVTTTVTGDKPQHSNAWTLKESDPARAGRFLNIPIHYGNWVPITAAKALVEEVARGRLPHKPLERKEEEVEQGDADRRADKGDVVYVNHHNRGHPNHRQYQTKFRPPPPTSNTRRQDSSKAIRYPSHKQKLQEKQQQAKKIQKKPSKHFNHIGQNIRTKTPQTSFPFVPSFNSLQALNPFNFFDQSRSTFTTPRAVPSQQHLSVQNQEKSSQESFNAIQTIPAPDLSKFGPGPPIIELDSGADGEIILGRPYHVGSGHDHLASFVSVDFDGFSAGDNVQKKKKTQEKEKLSIIVEGKSNAKPRDQSDLVNFLNNDRDNAAAFVISSDKAVPQGFAKIDLPFMDPTKHRGDLPKAFIAPKGIAIPDGYKGKPLPHQPEEVNTVTTENVSRPEEERPVSLFERRPTTFQRTPAYSQLDIKLTSEPARPAPTSSSLFRGSWEKNKQYQKDFLNKIKLKAREKYDKPESGGRPEASNNGKFKVNNKIKEARKEFRQTPPSTLPPNDLVIPVQNKLNLFKKVNDQEEIVSTTPDAPLLDIISAGDYDDDPISLVFEPEEVDLTQSTLEQAESELESTSVESSTNFAPTVITTTFVDTTSTTVSTSASSSETTTTTSTTTSSTTTTTTTVTTATTQTSSTSTTAPGSTESPFVKVTTEDPFVRLEEVRRKKYKFGKENYPRVSSYQGDLSFGDDLDTGDSLSTETPPFNFADKFISSFRTRKFGGGTDKNGEKFGRKIVLKKRPLWRKKNFNVDNLSGSIVPTPNPRFFQRTRFPAYSPASPDSQDVEFKAPLRPHFDGFVPGPWRRHQRKPIRRSTVAPPITVDAEIYEVHPKTRLRITTQAPAPGAGLSVKTTTTNQPLGHGLTEETDYSYQDDYVYEPTTSEVEDSTTPQYQEYVPTVETETVSTTEQAVTASESTSTEEVHETADKHTVTERTETETDQPALDAEYSSEDTIEDVVRIDFDIENEIIDQDVEESQQIETTWNGVLPSEEHTVASTRLTSYKKNVDTSKFGDDTDYKHSDLKPQVNEHGKPLPESEKAEVDDSATWQASVEPVRSYYEINRSDDLSPVVRIEEVEITEPKDYSEPDIIYDVTKDGFEDDSNKDSYTVPVSVAFNVPEEIDTPGTSTETSFSTTTSELRETETTSVLPEQTTTPVEIVSTTQTTTAEVQTTTLSEEVTETTTSQATTRSVPSTTFRSYSLINRNRPSKYDDVFLGSRGSVSTTTKQPSTTEVIDLNKSAHKVPDNLWSSFKKSLHETSTARANETSEEVSFTTQSSVTLEIVKDLPKPNEHESEVLVVEKFPKSFGFKGKNREKWSNSRRFPRPRKPFLPLAPKQNNKAETTTVTTTEEVSQTGELLENIEQVQSLFGPTVSPPKSAEEVTDESAKHPLLNEIKNALYPRQKAINSIFSKQDSPARSKQKPNGVPRGANTDVFRNFGGNKLSQAEFERSILGVSTATEISVKSMICVKGRCFNADDSGRLLPN